MSRSLTSLPVTLTLLLLLAVPAVAGPPWITIEYPVNPHDPELRGALLVVRTYHHDTPLASAVTAKAISAVEGRRAQHGLEVTETSRPGVYAVRDDLPEGGDWVVAVTRRGPDGGDRATALVAMNAAREILAVHVPHRTAENGRWVVPRDPTEGEIDGLLRTATAMSLAAADVNRTPLGAGVGLLLLVLLPSGVWLARSRDARRP